MYNLRSILSLKGLIDYFSEVNDRSMLRVNDTTFNNEFDLTERSLSEIIIKETFSRDNCIIWDYVDTSKAYNAFIIAKNSRSKTICEIAFHKSSKTDKYLPRPTFKKKCK
ncbi:MAG: hypothetical protein ACJAVW_002079 [Spirosomataceae bacterium]|jgi:hypothetical protein